MNHLNPLSHSRGVVQEREESHVSTKLHRVLKGSLASLTASVVTVGLLSAAPAHGADGPPGFFTIKGSGWGHGVGLSQYGAKAMAEAGHSAHGILRHYYSGTAIGRAEDSRVISVNVRYQSRGFVARLRSLERGGRLNVCAMRGGRCVASHGITDSSAGSRTAGSIRVYRYRDRVRARVTDQNGRARTVTGTRIRIRWSGTRYMRGDAAVLRMDNAREYRHGQMLVYRGGAGRVNAILRLRLQEEYLRGIAEMPSSWHYRALRAQAIIARTYALKTGAGRKSDCDCHLRDSVVHQAYSGWGKESEGTNARYGRRWVAAVNATDNRVLRYGGALAGTYYYSSSGGHTLNSQDVWSSRVPYLQSVDDRWSLTAANPNRSWSTRLSQSRASSMFGITKVLRVEVTSRYEGGAVRAVTAYGPRRTKTISGKADYMRSRFGLKSAWISSITPAR